MSYLELDQQNVPVNGFPAVLEAGSCLIAAQSEEAKLSMKCCKHPEDESLFREWALARRRVEECQQKYTDSFEQCAFPDV